MGFSEQTWQFYAALELDNSREYWAAHKADYERYVNEPMRELLAELADEFGTAKLFRPHRDVRFSKDKSPYKTHQGGYVPVGHAMDWYVQVSADGLLTGGGFYEADADRLRRFREQVAADGQGLRDLLDALPKSFELGGDTLVRAPRGFDPDHPHADLLKHKQVTLTRHYRDLPANQIAAVRRDWRAVAPVLDWLDEAMN